MISTTHKFAKLKSGEVYAVYSDNEAEETMHLVPRSQWVNAAGAYDPQKITCEEKHYSEIAVTDTNITVVENFNVDKFNNFNITNWADDFWSFTEHKDKQGEPLPITVQQRVGFCLQDALGAIEGIPQDFGYAIAEKRANVCGLKCTPGFLVCIASIANTPGEIVMFIHAFRHEQDSSDSIPGEDRKYNAADFFHLTKNVTPSKDHMSKMWDAQKGGPKTRVDNWLDFLATEPRFIKAIRDGYCEMPELL